MNRSLSSRIRRTAPGALAALLVVAGTVGVPLAVATATPAAAAGSTTFYSPGTPSLATITNGTTAAPWNLSQGDPGSPAYASQSPGTVLPTYTPGGATTGSGVTAEPNLAVYPGVNSGTDGDTPYPNGTVGTPGPLDGYCGTGSQTQEYSGTPAKQPADTTLPLAPAYFPHVVKNADGSLTGYFDYRPKDEDEALVAATSTDNGKDWTYDGEALEQNPGYCASSDVNDDGQGHANIITVDGNTYLYTLARAAGDMQGVGMLIHKFAPTESSPLAGLPSTEEIGIDPDAFVPTGSSSVGLTHGTAQAIPLTTLGTPGSPEQLVMDPNTAGTGTVGSFVDLTQTPTGTGTPPTVITCTGLGTSSLTGCTTASGKTLTVDAGDLVEQVLGFTTPSSDTGLVIPAGPNKTTGDGGLASFTSDIIAASGPGFANSLTGTTFNDNAPNRLYVNGSAIYCSGANANPTTHIEDCTTGDSPSSLTLGASQPITGDPIVPATAYNVGGGDGMTNGLVAPDGIVGVLPSYPGAPSGSTIVMYTEKELNYYDAGETTGSGTLNSATGQTISFTPGTYISQDLPSTGPWSVQIGATTNVSGSTATAIVPLTCTSLNETAGTLGGCTVASTYNGWTYASNSYIAAPGATTVAPGTLALTGEGKATDVSKLYKNNEDLSVVRVAYTTDGVNFSTTGLANGGIISGAGCESGNCASNGGGAYDDLTDPSSTTNPLNASGQIDLNKYSAPGTPDATEMRWAGSAGTIITNPNGTYGLFLSGAYAADGDSDAFNQIFYSESTDGEHWTVPQVVLSTDYTFAASVAQDDALAAGHDDPLGISAYYEGRAYGPSVVQNSDGTLTMVFSGYRMPGDATAGETFGTNPSAQWTIGTTDPDLYRNILTVTLDPAATATESVASQTTVTASPSAPVAGQSVTYTATVSNPATGAGDPTGTVTFTGDGGTLCPSVALDGDVPDQATCTTTYSGGAQSDDVTASYSGDSTFSGSSGSAAVSVGAALTVASSTTPSGYGASGNSLAFADVVTSDSPDSLTSVAVSDGLGQTISCPNSTLAAGTSETCTSTYPVTQAEVDAGSITDTTTASAVDGTTAVSSAPFTLTVEASGATSALGLSETTTSTGYGLPGDSVPFSDTVTDTGTTTISNIAVSDTLDSGVTCPSSTLTPGDSEICTGTYTVTEADVTGGSVTDTATATGTGPQGAPVASGPSSAEVPAFTPPAAPIGVTATAGSRSATVSWTPGDDGGSAVTGYTVSDGVGDTCSSTTTTCTVGGLTNGTPYTFTVTATNEVGTSAASTASSPVTPTTVPDAPTGVVASAGDQSVSVSWTAADDEGSVVTGYTVTSTGGQTCSTSGTTCDVTGLTNGTAYSFTVTATNADGTSSASAATTSVTPSTVPDAPSGVVATAGDASAIISWTAAGDEGSPVTGYVVTASNSNPPKTCTTTAATTCTITGLANGASYTFTVTATNADGTGGASAPSAAVVPTTNTAVITSADTDTVAQGKAVKFAVTSSGTPSAAISATGLPAGMTLKSSKGGKATLEGKPVGGAGVYAFTLTADNGTGPGSSQTFTLTVFGITSPDAATFTAGTYGSFTIATTPPLAGASVSATLSKKQSGLSFTPGPDGTATLSGTPAAGDKTAVVTVKATDGSLSVTQKLTVTIDS